MEITIKLADIWSTLFLLALIVVCIQIGYGLRVYDQLVKLCNVYTTTGFTKRMYVRYMILSTFLSLMGVGLIFAILVHYSN